MGDEGKSKEQLIAELAALRRENAQLKAASLDAEAQDASVLSEYSLLRTLVDTMPDYIYVKDVEGRFVLANPATAILMGLDDLEDLIGKTDYDFTPKEFADRYAADEQKIIKAGQPLINHEEQFFDLADNETWHLTTKIPLRDKHNQIVGLVGIGRDITAQKRAEQALYISEQRYRALLEQASDSIFVTGEQDRILEVNQQTCILLGYTQDELVGAAYPDFVDPENLAANPIPYGQFRVGETSRSDRIFRRKDGSLVSGEAHGTLLDDGRFLTIVRDVTERKQAEDALRASEESYRSLVANLPNMAVILFDHDLRFTLVAGPEVEASGYSKEIMEGKTLHEALPPEFAQMVEPNMRAVLAGKHFTAELPFEDRFYHYTYVPIKNARGEVLYAMILAQNITQRRQADEALRASEERFRTIFENGPIGIAVADGNNRILNVNQRICEITGYEKAEIRELKFFREITHPDDREADTTFMRQITAGEIDGYWLEKRYIRKDGSTIWVGLTASVVRAADGKVDFGIAMIEDITERRRTQDALRASEERFRQFAENIDIYFWLADLSDMQILYTSPAFGQIFGRPRADLHRDSRAWRSAIHPDDYERMASRLEGLHNNQLHLDEEFRIQRPDGDIRWVRGRWFPVHNAQGEAYRVAGIMEDITERRKAEQQALELALEREWVEVMQQFIANVAHDFRTPLSTVKTKLYVLERSADPEQIKRNIAVMNQEIERVENLLESFVTLSRLDEDARFEYRPIAIGGLVEEVTLKLASRAEEKRLRFSTSVAADTRMVMGSAEALGLALQAIVDNAVKYTPEEGAVSIQCLTVNGFTLVDVQDSGIGIDEASLTHIFERLYRADAARSAATGGGAGLGLSIAQKIIELHGGRIEVESAPGAGSRFCIYLPARDAP